MMFWAASATVFLVALFCILFVVEAAFLWMRDRLADPLSENAATLYGVHTVAQYASAFVALGSAHAAGPMLRQWLAG